MKQYYLIFYFISNFITALTSATFAQNILTEEDRLFFIQHAKIPIAVPNYTFSYIEHLEKNANLWRLRSISSFLQFDYEHAILFLEKVLIIQSNTLDLYRLGLFYVHQNQLKKAYQVFDQADQLNPLDRKSACAKAAIHLKQGAFHKAFDLIEAYPSELKDNINAFHLNYFIALVTLAQGNKNDAFKRLKAIHAQSEYKEDANKLLAHFFKAAE